MSDRRRILVVGGVWPHVTANQEAANVVSFEITRGLAESGLFDVTYACVGAAVAAPPAGAEADFAILTQLGVHVLRQPVTDQAPRKPRSSLAKLALAPPDAWLQGTAAAAAMHALVKSLGIDLVLTIWTEYGTAACHDLPVPVAAYYGNPDFKSPLAQAWFAWRYGPGRFRPSQLCQLGKLLLVAKSIERAHLRVMRKLAFVGEVAASDADYYRHRGVNASYMNNMWPNHAQVDWQTLRDQGECEAPVKIVGNVGNLSATGNTFGMYTIASSILPELKRVLGSGGFEIHLFGGRTPHPHLQEMLRDPHIQVRGFVKDLDSEILSAPIFLVANNHHLFKVGHTRFLHAWSLGACVVGFADSHEAMPEIRHGVNALLGRKPGEVAEMIGMAARDRTMRRTVGQAGFETLRKYFNPRTVSAALAAQMSSIAPAR